MSYVSMFLLNKMFPMVPHKNIKHRLNTGTTTLNIKKLEQSYHEWSRIFKVGTADKVLLLDQKLTPMSLSLTRIDSKGQINFTSVRKECS